MAATAIKGLMIMCELMSTSIASLDFMMMVCINVCVKSLHIHKGLEEMANLILLATKTVILIW